MAPSLIRSVCRKSPREGGAVYSLFVGIVLLCCLPMMAIHLVTVVVSTRSFFFFCWICKFSQSGYLLHVFASPFFQNESCGSDLSGEETKTKKEARRDCVATNGTHTWLLLSFICLLLSRWKVFPQGHLKGPLKMVSNVFCCCSRNVFVFCPFSLLLLREISRYLFSCPQDLSLYMNLSTFIVKTL